MIAIADSGSTKTEWRFLENGTECGAFRTIGLNPYFADEKEINNACLPFADFCKKAKQLYFYGAGCGSNEAKMKLANSLGKIFQSAKILIETDLLGAGIALFGRNSGVACILGTGSNSGLFENGQIITKTPSLGFILGDEGSGADLGKNFLNGIYTGAFSNEIVAEFKKWHNLELPDILNKVYKEQFPNRYLASFCPFIGNNIAEQSVEDMVKSRFEILFIKYLSKYFSGKDKIGFVGSVAWNFRRQLIEVAKKFTLEIPEIIPAPIDRIVRYHQDG